MINPMYPFKPCNVLLTGKWYKRLKLFLLQHKTFNLPKNTKWLILFSCLSLFVGIFMSNKTCKKQDNCHLKNHCSKGKIFYVQDLLIFDWIRISLQKFFTMVAFPLGKLHNLSINPNILPWAGLSAPHPIHTWNWQ